MSTIIEVKRLSKSFGENHAVNDLSFAVKKGSLFAFLGQNGAGKSTTINMLIGLLKKDGGEILYEGATEYADFKNRIGVVFQENISDDRLTVEENLLLYATLYLGEGKRAEQEIKSRFDEIVDLLSLGNLLKQSFHTLSGGQKRKVELARALWNRPQILFLDEPTTGLDPKTRAEVWKLLHTIRKESGMTLFLTTHYMEETADADEVVIIHKGKRVAQGTPAELKDQYSYDRILLTPEDEKLLERQLERQRLPWVKTADTYAIRTTNTTNTIELLYQVKDNLRFFESVKGSMDDVFLSAVGEQLDGGDGKGGAERG